MTDREAFDEWFIESFDIPPKTNAAGEPCGNYSGPAWRLWQAAIKHEREACAKACEEVDEPGWTGYECPNTFNDGKWAAAAAMRARGLHTEEGERG